MPLASPKGDKLRPTSNRVREAIFDILGERILGSRFLDLFAGTGAVGIEALSRGAAGCLFVEGSRLHANLIRQSLVACGLERSGSVLQGNLPGCLLRSRCEEPFDLAFVDPPYGDDAVVAVLEELGTGMQLLAGAWVILEHRKSRTPPPDGGRLRFMRKTRYGDTELSFYELPGETPHGVKKN